MGYKLIHAPIDGCALFRGEHENARSWPVCTKSSFKTVGKSMVPMTVVIHFPLIPRLRWRFATTDLARLMAWQNENRSSDSKMRGPADSPQFEHIGQNCGDFASDPRNIHLGLCADGVNPYCHIQFGQYFYVQYFYVTMAGQILVLRLNPSHF